MRGLTLTSARNSSRLFAAILIFCFVLAPAQPALAAFGDGTPTVPNANVFGQASETAKVDEPTGAFTQRIQLDIPPGRDGLQPDLALEYNSQNTSDGIVGYGWSLSIPYIQRLNKTGSQNLYSGDAYFASSVEGELVSASSTTTSATTSPSFLDTLPLTLYEFQNVTSESRSYTVPSGGSNKLFIALVAKNACGDAAPTATLNGDALTVVQISGTANRACYYIAYRANPSSGTFQINFSGSTWGDYVLFTLQNAAQTSPIDTSSVTNEGNQSSNSTSVTTTGDYDLLISIPKWETANFSSFGSQETQYLAAASTAMGKTAGSYKVATSSGSHTMTINISSARDVDEPVIAVKPAVVLTGADLVTHRARVDDGAFNAYSFSSNTWTVYDKKGTRYTYGSSDDGRMYDTGAGGSTNTFKWMLQEIRDTNDNFVKYEYLRDSNQLYPYRVIYTGHGSIDGPFTVTFATSTRSDTRVSYASGFAVTTSKRITQIAATVSGAAVRQYDFAYGTGNNGYRSLLSSVQERGYDESGIATLMPTTTFSYLSSSEQFFEPGNPTTISSSAIVVGDTSGDGVNDLARFTSPTGYVNYQGSGSTDTFSPPDYWASGSNPLERGVRYVDVNGDGKSDIVVGFKDNQAGTTTRAVYINNFATSSITYGWTATTTWGATPNFALKTLNGLYTLSTGVFGDVNGDGLPDYEAYVSTHDGPTAYIHNGQGWDARNDIFVPVYTFPFVNPTETASQLADVNADGLDDWVYSDGANIAVRLNNGTGWNASPTSAWTIATSTLYSSGGTYYDRGIRFMDINGDGLPDFIRSYYSTSACSGPEKADVKTVLLNTGNGWATSTAYTLPAYITSCNVSNGTLKFDEYANFNGNGQFEQDVITVVQSPRGGATSVVYEPSTSDAVSGSQAGGRELPLSYLVVTDLGAYDGRGNGATTTYGYRGGRLYTNSGVRDRKFAGFGMTSATSSLAAVVTYFHQGTGIDGYRGEQNDGFAQINRPFRKDVLDLSSSVKQRTYYKWDTIAHGSSTFIGIGQQVEWAFANDGTHKDKATEYQYSSTNNDLAKIIEYGEVTGSTNGTFTDTGSDKRTTNIQYAASSSVNMSVPIRRTLLDNNNATTSDQVLYYDTLAYGSVNVGNNTKEESWLSGYTYASSSKTYNSYGLVATSTDRRGYATSYVYDQHNLYVATTTNPLLQATQFLYNYSNGKVKWKSDPNNSLTRNTYDGLGRLTGVAVSSTSSPTTYATTTTYVYTDSTSTPSSIKRSDWQTHATTTDSYQYVDGLGRLIQERKMSPTAGFYWASDRIYDVEGNVRSQSLPYISSGTAFSGPTGTAALYSNYQYDAQKRVIAIGTVVGTTTNSYSQWTTTTTDPNSNIKDYTTDAFGNLAEVIERLQSGNLTTTYTYDSKNNLATTTDSLGNVRGFTYDGLNRRLTAHDLHVATDTTFSIWSYTFDHAGNQTSQTDPKGQVVNRTYDALNRMLTEDYTGDAGTEVTLLWDNCVNGVGYLCSASSTAATTTNWYDINGRITFSTTSVFTISYAMGYQYDRQGNVTAQKYPNFSETLFGYNLANLPSRIQRKQSGGSFSDMVSSFTYAPTGQPITTVFGNGASTTRTYDASALYRLTNLRTLSGGSYTQDFAYTYDAVGNITQIANTANASSSATVQYIYDQLNRLTSASTTVATSTPYSLSYTYDALGNILNIATGVTSGISTGATTTPSILDTLNLTIHTFTGTSDSFSYTVPSGGTSKLLVVLALVSNPNTVSATQNGSALTVSQAPGTANRAYPWIGYLANPSSGTFSLSLSSSGTVDYVVMTLKDAAQTSPVDVSSVTNEGNQTSNSTSVTTNIGYDLLLSIPKWETATFSSFGSGETPFLSAVSTAMGWTAGSYKSASTTAGTETMTINISSARDVDETVVAIKSNGATSSIPVPVGSTYTYAGTGYANPHAVTSITSGVSTTTYTYDNNGNLAQKVTDGITTTYLWDYANRLIALGSGGATTTYGYDAFGARVFQISTTSTSTYPFKWFSVASTTAGSTDYATTSEYLFNGNTLLATADRKHINGAATGTVAVRYVHPDHLGSTNVVTDENANVQQISDYYPFGATRINTGTSASARQYIGQFADQSGLSYLNARYYDGSRGQFLSQDPVFLGLGVDQRTELALMDPQLLNSYSYARNNPIINKDPDGEWVALAARLALQIGRLALQSYSAATLGYSGGEVLNANVLFVNDYAPDERYSANFAFGENIVTGIAGFKAKNVFENAVLTLGPDVHRFASRFDRQGPTYPAPISFDQFNLWTTQTPDRINPYTYFQNVTYSQKTGHPSNTSSQSGGGGGNPDYASQTYQTPNGSIVDWGGNVVVAAPSSQSTSAVQSAPRN